MTEYFEAAVGNVTYRGSYYMRDGVLAIIHYHNPAHPISEEARRAMIKRVCEIQHIENPDQMIISRSSDDGCFYLKPPH